MAEETTQTKKYEFTGETKHIGDITVRRIRLLVDIEYGEMSNRPKFKAGTIGGWIEREDNLSQEGRCFVADNACVYGHAFVKDDALVADDANVFGFASVSLEAFVHGHATVCGFGVVTDHAGIGGHAMVYEYATVKDSASVIDHATAGGACTVRNNATLSGYATASGQATIGSFARIFDVANVTERANICGPVSMSGHACARGKCHVSGKSFLHQNCVVKDFANVLNSTICNSAVVGDHAVVGPNVRIAGNAYIGSNAGITSNDDYITFKVPGESAMTLTYIPAINSLFDEKGIRYETLDDIRKAYQATPLLDTIVEALFMAYPKGMTDVRKTVVAQASGDGVKIITEQTHRGDFASNPEHKIDNSDAWKNFNPEKLADQHVIEPVAEEK
jgi:NDP-sugar pyrophosphorylase family protein